MLVARHRTTTPLRSRVFDAPGARPGLLVLALVCVVTCVGLAARGGLALWFLIALLTPVVAYAGLRWPRSVAFVPLTWLVFEKAVEPHLPINSLTIDIIGDYSLVLALLWTVLVNLLRHRPRVLSVYPIGLGLVAFVILNIVSAITNGVPFHVAELGILSTTHTMLMFLIVINLGLREQDIYRFVNITVVILGTISLISLFQIFPTSPAWKLAADPPYYTAGGFTRVQGIFEHPNSLGNDLALVLPLVLMLLFRGELSARRRTFMVGVAGVMLAALILTGSREAWGGLLVGALVLGLVVDRALLRVLLTRVLPGLLVLLLLTSSVLSRLQESQQGNQRFVLFKLSLPIIRSHLFLGVGPGRYGGHVASVTHTPLYAQYDLTDYFYGSGNQLDGFWTHLVAESGVLGAVALLACIVACFVVGRRAYQRSVDPQRRAVLLGLLFAAPVSVALSLLSSALETGPRATLFWGFMGMLVVLASGADDQQLRPENTG